jgi:uncharacterized metal-binding protein
MPSGKIHDKIAIIFTVPVFVAGCFLLKYNFVDCFVFTSSVLFAQLMFGPDLDAKSSQYNRWGIIKWIWFPYRKIFKHRSSFSHGLLLGPILRCVYLITILLLCFMGICFFIYHQWGINLLSQVVSSFDFLIYGFDFLKPYIVVMLIGFFIGTAIHTLTDKFVSFFNNLI